MDFLTGPQPTLQLLSRDAFKFGDVDGTMNHNTRFALVDRKGQIRGYYGTTNGRPGRESGRRRAPSQKGNRLITLHDLPTDECDPERHRRHPAGLGLYADSPQESRRSTAA